MLRIIAGEYRGRKIEQPDLNITRPTMDRVREAVFSSIQFKLEKAIVLDLFAGSGVFSFESVSRGAMKSIAVENNLKAINVITKNKEILNAKNVEIVNADAIRFLDMKKGAKFKFIFMDPPFSEMNLYNEALEKIVKNNLLESTGYIILETNNVQEVKIPKTLMIQKSKKYGKIDILLISNV